MDLFVRKHLGGLSFDQAHRKHRAKFKLKRRRRRLFDWRGAHRSGCKHSVLPCLLAKHGSFGHTFSLRSEAATNMGISTVDDPDEALHEFAVCSLLIGYFWFAKKLKKPPDLLLSCCLMPSFLLLLDGSFDAANGLLEGNLDRANAFDEVLLSLAAWFFAFTTLEASSRVV